MTEHNFGIVYRPSDGVWSSRVLYCITRYLIVNRYLEGGGKEGMEKGEGKEKKGYDILR